MAPAGPTRSCCGTPIGRSRSGRPAARLLRLALRRDVRRANAGMRRWTRARPFVLAVAPWTATRCRRTLPYPVAVGRRGGQRRHSGGRHRRGLSAGLRRQPDLGRRAPGAAGPDRRACGSWRRWSRSFSRLPNETQTRHAGRSRRLRVPLRPRRHAARNPIHKAVPLMTTSPHGPLRVGIGGPVGTGKTALMDALCKHFRDRYDIAAITNDIYTKEDAEFLTRAGSLPVRAHHGHRNRRLPAHRDPRGRLDQPGRRGRDAAALSRAGPDPDRERRRQSGGDLQSGTGGSDDLCHRRFGRRQDPAQGRPGHHAQRSAGHQQDRPRALCRRQPGSDGPRREEDARRPAVRLRQHPWPARVSPEIAAFIEKQGGLDAPV